MSLAVRLRQFAWQIGEFLFFGLGLVVALRATQNLTLLEWQWVLLLGAMSCVLGAVPFPWERRVPFVAIGAFLAAFGILGYIDWRLEYFLMFEREGAWQNLPRVVLGPQNLVPASALSGAAVLGLTIARRLSGGRRRTSG